MIEEGSCWCWTERNDFNIPADDQGNNIVTGEGKEQKDNCKHFTCIDLEVFSVDYDIHPYEDLDFKNYLERQKIAIMINNKSRLALKSKNNYLEIAKNCVP